MHHETIRQYIRDGWGRSLTSSEAECETSFKLPRPYVPPCDVGHFRTLFYWDTYFTGLGLMTDGRVQEMKDNIENFRHVIGRFGYVPNGLAKAFLSRSQPPFLTWMAGLVYEETRDDTWLSELLPALDLEYTFWMTKRMTKIGLNRYGHQADDEELTGFAHYVNGRLGRKETSGPSAFQGGHDLAEAESGWDFTPRFEGRAMDFCPVDLNAIMFENERLLAFFHETLGNGQQAKTYKEASEKRQRLMLSHMVDLEGIFRDYDVLGARQGKCVTAASFFPYAVGLAEGDNTKPLTILLERLEHSHGLSTVAKHVASRTYQWDHPNMWPPLVLIAWRALKRAGMDEDARRIANKYLDAIASEFALSGHLYEKYDVTDGLKAYHNEYPMTRMLGWTAGVYAYLDTHNNPKG